MMRPAPDPRILSWVAIQAVPELFTTSICEAEILSGIEFLAPGERKDTLMGAADRLFGEAMVGRIFGFEG
jgi:toxin FitB